MNLVIKNKCVLLFCLNGFIPFADLQAAEMVSYNCTGFSARATLPVQSFDISFNPGTSEFNFSTLTRASSVQSVSLTNTSGGVLPFADMEEAVRKWIITKWVINDEYYSGGMSRDTFTYQDRNGQTFSGYFLYGRNQSAEEFIGNPGSWSAGGHSLYRGIFTPGNDINIVNQYTIVSSHAFGGGTFKVTPQPYITFIGGRNVSFPVVNKNRSASFSASVVIRFDGWMAWSGSPYVFAPSAPVTYTLSGTCTYTGPELSWNITPVEIEFGHVSLGSSPVTSSFIIQQKPDGGLASGTFRASFTTIDGESTKIALGDSYATISYLNAGNVRTMLQNATEYPLIAEKQIMDVTLFPTGKKEGGQSAIVNFTFAYD